MYCICVICDATGSRVVFSSCAVCRIVGLVSGAVIVRVDSCLDALGCVIGVVFCDVVSTTFGIVISV